MATPMLRPRLLSLWERPTTARHRRLGWFVTKRRGSSNNRSSSATAKRGPPDLVPAGSSSRGSYQPTLRSDGFAMQFLLRTKLGSIQIGLRSPFAGSGMKARNQSRANSPPKSRTLADVLHCSNDDAGREGGGGSPGICWFVGRRAFAADNFGCWSDSGFLAVCVGSVGIGETVSGCRFGG